ncbi:MAG: prepilin-type N-terminal cleavage/methylation domain-containing protein [Phycisphaerae bacterium]
MIKRNSKPGFSLVELVIVIVIIGIIAAIAVPRISRGAAGAGASALRGDLYVLRNAIDLFAAEHMGAYPDDLDATYILQMTTFTDDAGATNAAKVDPFIFGPYLVAVPKLKVGEGLGNGKGSSTVAAAAAAGVGWVYNKTLGTIKANSGTAEDDSGTLYSDY